MSSGPIHALEEARRRAAFDAGNRSEADDDRTVRTVDSEPDALSVAASVHPGRVPQRAALAALQRSAGNAAVTALLDAKTRPGGAEKAADLDAAVREARTGQPQLEPVEKGLRVAKDLGVPVDIDGAEHKPSASALAVTKTGFGPSAVPAKKPVAPPKSTAPLSPMAKAARPAANAKTGGGGKQPGTAGSGSSTSAAPPATGGTTAGPVNVLAPPEPPTRLKPTDDPGFSAVTTAVGGFAKAKAAHPSAGSKAKEAQDAAVAPADDVDCQAKAAKVDTMDAQRPGSFDKKAFIEAVKAAIEAKSPKTLEEADKYKESGQAGQVKDEVKGLVGSNKEQSAEAIETATVAPPDASKAVPKQVVAMPPENPGPSTAIPAEGAAPKAAPREQLNLEAGKHQANQELADADVTEPQLATSNEPEFTGALAAKKEAAEHAGTAPAQFRQDEAAALAQTRGQAAAAGKAGVDGIHGAKVAALGQVSGSKANTKSSDEAKRAEVTAKVQSIFGAAEADVKKILDAIDPKVDKAFQDGEKAARDQFEGFVKAKMSAYKKDRYGGALGGLRWAKDKLLGMPSEVNEFYAAGRELYLRQMDQVISHVADIVGADLGAAKARIAKGKSEIAAYVKTLGPELKSIGAQAAKEVEDQFGKLESEVAAKQQAVVDTLATKYVEARQGLDDRIEALQAENKGLVDKALGAIKDVIQTILKLKDMLLNVLARAAAAVSKIIKDPIGFLGNFVRAVKSGIVNFGNNILEHLKKGLQRWLFGALAEGGIELPQKWDGKGVLQLVLSILGLTWARVRGRIVAKIGEPAMSFVEKGFEVVKILVVEGLGGLWKWVLEKAGDIKEMVMSQIQEMVAVQIIKAGITWLISMLNPVGAFIKACKMIYDVVMFFVERAAQIKEFVDAVLDSVESIAAGGVGAVAAKIEDALGKLVPILIGFLASLLGLGGIADKIKKILETIQKPVMKVVDWVVGKAVAFGKKFKGAAAWVKGKVAKGKAWVKGKVEAGKAWAKRRLTGTKNDVRTPQQKQLAVDAAIRDIEAVMSSPGAKRPQVFRALLAIKKRYALNQLRLIDGALGEYHAHAELNPTKDSKDAKAGDINGMVAAYRGIHFKSTLDSDAYDRALRTKLVGTPTFSIAALKLAGSRTTDGSDVPTIDKEAAAQLIQEQVKTTKDPGTVRQWWGGKAQYFDSLFLALLQRYVNTYEGFGKDIAEKKVGPFEALPFISTTKKAAHAAAYALGQKFTKPEERRSSGIVGRAMVYLFSLTDLQKQDPANVQRLQDGGKIKVKARIIQEGEVAFTGSIPGDNLVAEHEAHGGMATTELARRLTQSAVEKAKGKGGLQPWD